MTLRLTMDFTSGKITPEPDRQDPHDRQLLLDMYCLREFLRPPAHDSDPAELASHARMLENLADQPELSAFALEIQMVYRACQWLFQLGTEDTLQLTERYQHVEHGLFAEDDWAEIAAPIAERHNLPVPYTWHLLASGIKSELGNSHAEVVANRLREYEQSRYRHLPRPPRNAMEVHIKRPHASPVIVERLVASAHETSVERIQIIRHR